MERIALYKINIKKESLKEEERQNDNRYGMKKMVFLCSRISRPCPFIITLTLIITYVLSLSMFLLDHEEHRYYQLTTFASIKYMTGKTKRSEPKTENKKINTSS